MGVKDIAKAAAVILQADDIVSALEIGDYGDSDVCTLVKCINLATAELCTDGFPVCVSEVLPATKGFIALTLLSREPSGVREVTKDGVRVPFSVDPRGVRVSGDGMYTVVYDAVPKEVGLSDDAEVNALCDCNIAAYLTARNYCLITGRTDEASVWDQRYNAEAEKRRLTRRAKLKGRKWL